MDFDVITKSYFRIALNCFMFSTKIITADIVFMIQLIYAMFDLIENSIE